jgi:hypothetical protein
MLRFFPLLLAALLPAAESPKFQLRIEVKDPRGAPLAPIAKAVCEEWYPKIEAALFGPAQPLPYPELHIVFEPTIQFGDTVVPAYADGNTIHINSEYSAALHKPQPGDFPAMIAHELTHVNQNYPADTEPGWLVEGIADYVRHKYYEKDIQPILHLDANGNLRGFELDRNRGDFATEGYTAGYTVTGAFLYWLERKKDRKIVPVLNRALHDRRYSPKIFDERCGAPLNALWREFVAQSRAARV